MKSEQYNYRCSKDDLDLLAKLAKKHKLSSSAIIRNAVRFSKDNAWLFEKYLEDRGA